MRYCAAHPEYGQEASALVAANNKAAFRRRSDWKRNLTHCKRGHPLTADNVYPYGGGIGRKCKLCTKLHNEKPLPATEEQITRVTAALNAGQTISQICIGKRDGKRIGGHILAPNKLKLYRAQNPDFDRFVRSIAPGNLERSRQRRRNPQLFHANNQREEANDYHRIVELVPANLPPDMRDDIVQSIFLALLEGSLRRDPG